MFSIKNALELIDHTPVKRERGSDEEDGDEESKGARRHMKLSRKEEEMMGQVKSKMKYAGETYHRVAPAQVEISKKIYLLNSYYRSTSREEKTTRAS